MDAWFLSLSSALGASVDQIKLITCLLVSYPLGSLYIRVPASQPNIKHLFSVFISLIYFLPVLHMWTEFLQLLGSVLATYFIVASVQGPRMPWIVFAIVMGHLTVNHVLRAVYELGYETVDITGPQMVLVMKLTTFAWNVWDGRRPAGDLDKWQSEHRVTEFPSLLSFLGYSFYFPGVLVGPYIDYTSYVDLVSETGFSTPKGKEKVRADGRAVPKGRKRVAYRKMIEGLVWLGLFVVGSGHFNFGVAISDWFLTKGLLYRIVFFQICGVFERSKYYAIWTLTEGASILTGYGFTGYSIDGRSLWGGAANVNVAMIEFAPNFKVLVDSWNIKTNIWLRECMYKRVTPKGKKPGFRSSMITFATSAFWHGIAGGYYLTFLFGGFVQTAGRLCRTNLRPLFFSPLKTPFANSAPATTAHPLLPTQSDPPATRLKRVYDWAGTVATVLLVNYTCAPFMLLGVRESLRAWARLGWYGNWMVGGCLIFFYGGGRAVLKGVQEGRKRRAEERVVKSTKGDEVPAGLPKTPGPYVMPPMDLALEEIEDNLTKKID